MRRLPMLLGLALSISLPAVAGPLRDSVLAALDGVEDPPSRESLAPLGEGVAAELLEIARNPSVPPSRRGRAVTALGWFPDDAVHDALVAWLSSDDRLLARKAAGALATGWGDRAVEDLRTALQSDDLQLRVAVVKALASIDSDAARAVLEARLATETDPTVKDGIRTALGR